MKRDRGLPILIALLAGAAWSLPAPAPAPWAVRLDIASLTLSISGGGKAVRDRTALFEIGQWAGRWL
jgi:hypothetical protein